MIPAEKRLDRTRFATAFKRGRRVHTPGFLVIYYPTDTQHMAAVVSKKVAKGAVVRNMVRRRAYAALREVAPPCGTTIVIAKQPVRTYTFSDIHAELADATARMVGFTHHSR